MGGTQGDYESVLNWFRVLTERKPRTLSLHQSARRVQKFWMETVTYYKHNTTADSIRMWQYMCVLHSRNVSVWCPWVRNCTKWLSHHFCFELLHDQLVELLQLDAAANFMYFNSSCLEDNVTAVGSKITTHKTQTGNHSVVAKLVHKLCQTRTKKRMENTSTRSKKC